MTGGDAGSGARNGAGFVGDLGPAAQGRPVVVALPADQSQVQ